MVLREKKIKDPIAYYSKKQIAITIDLINKDRFTLGSRLEGGEYTLAVLMAKHILEQCKNLRKHTKYC